MAFIGPVIYAVALYCTDARWAVRKRLLMAGVSAEKIKTQESPWTGPSLSKASSLPCQKENPQSRHSGLRAIGENKLIYKHQTSTVPFGMRLKINRF
jgi:hypothetical protein